MKSRYSLRVDQWIKKSIDHEGGNPYSELIRLHRGLPVQAPPLEIKLRQIDNREDCADFHAAGFIRMMHQFSNSDHLSTPMKGRIKESLLNFKYWPDEPGIDSLCSWTENHFILFASTAYLTGLKYPQETFTNSGLTGKQMAERFQPRIHQWLNLRFSTGFSEWLSNVYYNEDFPALFNLLDFSTDEEIRTKATMIIDLMLVDLALNSFHGIFASSHGRSYEKHKKWAKSESTASLAGLLLGGESFQNGNFSAVSLILSNYKMPLIIKRMAKNHLNEADENQQICGFELKDAKLLGLNQSDPDHRMIMMGGEPYMHPRFIKTFTKMLDQYNWWENRFFSPFKSNRRIITLLRKTGLLSPLAHLIKKDTTRGYRGKAHIYTYRTNNYMMSSAQQYHVGYGGDQQSPWQVTLGDNATCFITHPGYSRTVIENQTPNYWTGSGTLPGVSQYKNCAIIIFKVNTNPGLYHTNRERYTHAWFPQEEFEEVIEEGGWIFASKREGYLGLWSRNQTEWGEEDKGKCDLIARGKQNIWICQTGSKEESGTFLEFKDRLLKASIKYRGLRVEFNSPGNGKLEYGWKKPLRVDGKRISLHGTHRYLNQFTKTTYPAKIIEFRRGEQFLKLDYTKGERTFDSLND